MELLRGLKPLTELEKGAVATIGNFDGVHIGHQALIRRLREKADDLNLPLLIIVFEPQPGEYFDQSNPPARLTSLREKISVLKKLGVDYVYCLKFDNHLALMEPAHFVQTYLLSLLNIKYLLLGEDFRFGKNRSGDIKLMRSFFNNNFREIHTFPDFESAGERVSSTKIRNALEASNMVYAQELMGRPYSMCGRVIKGDGRGREWGIPTANIGLDKKTTPLSGVYCVTIICSDSQMQQGVANIGCRPTVDGSKNILEVHILDFDQALYGEFIEIIFLHKLRDEVKFSSLEVLIATIKDDINATRHYFNHYNQKEHLQEFLFLCQDEV